MTHDRLKKYFFIPTEAFRERAVEVDRLFEYSFEACNTPTLENSIGPSYLAWRESFLSYLLEGEGEPEVISERWVTDDVLHRDAGPALVTRDKNFIYTFEYRRYGKLHRTDGPAILQATSYGNLIRAAYYQDGLLHRVGGPAIINCDAVQARRGWKTLDEDEVKIASIEYYQNNRLHNPAGPASLGRYKNNTGTWMSVDYYDNGRRRPNPEPGNLLFPTTPSQLVVW